jgi:hypothetical protein
MSQFEKTDDFEKWIRELHKSISESLETGSTHRLSIATELRTVTVDIYADADDMKKFNEMIKDVANAKDIRVNDGRSAEELN